MEKKTKHPNVLVVGSTSYANPYIQVGNVNCIGHTYVRPEDVAWADIVLFTGGSDVSPELYEEPSHPFTQPDWHRDMMEVEIFTWAKDAGKRMAGICRGSQFLNVMCGGKLHQHVGKHGIRGTHPIYDAETNKCVAEVTSTHHQISILPTKSKLIATGFEIKGDEVEVEAWYNGENKVLGVQFHPEYMPVQSTGWKYYQQLIKEYLL